MAFMHGSLVWGSAGRYRRDASDIRACTNMYSACNAAYQGIVAFPKFKVPLR